MSNPCNLVFDIRHWKFVTITMYFLKLYFRDLWVSLPFVGVLLAQIWIWWYVSRNIHQTTDNIFLHYNITFGIDLVGEWWKIYIIPAGGIAMLLINFLISFFSYRSDRFLSRTSGIMIFLLHILLAVSAFLTVNLNI